MSVKKKIPHVFNKSFYGKEFQSKWRIERTKIDKFSMSVKKKNSSRFNKSFYGKKFHQSKWKIERTKIDKFWEISNLQNILRDEQKMNPQEPNNIADDFFQLV